MPPTTHIQGNLHCAEFIGRDQHVTTYGFSAEDVERLIEKMIALLQAQAVFIPQSPSGDAPLTAEHAGERLTFHPGAALRLLKQRSERAYLLGLVIKRDHQIWATKFVPLGGSIDVRRAVQGWDIPVAFSEFRIPAPAPRPRSPPNRWPTSPRPSRAIPPSSSWANRGPASLQALFFPRLLESVAE